MSGSKSFLQFMNSSDSSFMLSGRDNQKESVICEIFQYLNVMLLALIQHSKINFKLSSLKSKLPKNYYMRIKNILPKVTFSFAFLSTILKKGQNRSTSVHPIK